MPKIQYLFFVVVLLIHGLSCGKWWEKHDLSKLALIKAPVADMLTGSIAAYGVKGSVSELYRQLPVSCNQPGKFPCVRAFQSLFNEVFIGATCNKQECKGSFPGVVYAIDAAQKPISLFFLLEEKVIFLSDLHAQGFDLDTIPCPTWMEEYHEVPTVVLSLPWHDTATNMLFSAGTRFVHKPRQDTEHLFCIELLQFSPLRATRTFVPKARALIEQLRTEDEGRDLMVSVVAGWTDHVEGDIAYVWGGGSVITGCDAHESFEFVNNERYGVELFTRPHFHTHEVTGLDCSGLVWLARRTANMHSPYRNTGMLQQFLKTITKNDTLEKGDLLWIRGHVMMIGEIERNEVFEAAGYSSGYGKVQKIHLKDRFVGINNFDELLRAYFAREPLIFKGIDGKQTSFNEFKILKLI